MNLLIYSLILLSIFNLSLSITDKEAMKYDKEFTNKLDDKPVDIKKSCDGICFQVPMNLPSDGYWDGVSGLWSSGWGTPSVNINSIWMWSNKKRGEGVNLKYSFIKDKRYCFEMDVVYSTHNG